MTGPRFAIRPDRTSGGYAVFDRYQFHTVRTTDLIGVAQRVRDRLNYSGGADRRRWFRFYGVA